jgi:DNA-binding CsgD family transcriptional regulator
MAHLTPTQTRIAQLVAAGMSNAEIGHELGIAVGTVKTHLGRIYVTLGYFDGNPRVRLALAVQRGDVA